MSGDASLSSELSTETSFRVSGDALLSTGLSNEISARVSGDASLSTGLSNEISARVSGDASLSTGLSNETSNRLSGDASLSSELSTETSNRVSSDASLSTDLSTETSARVSGDASLLAVLSTETSTRVSGDTSLLANLSTETSARISGDISLSTSLSTETSARISGDVSLSSGISTINNLFNTTLTLSHLSITGDTTMIDLSLNNGVCTGNFEVQGQIINTSTQPDPSDNSVIVPTTQWVQSAISYNRPFVPIFHNFSKYTATGSIDGPSINWSGTWNMNNYAVFRMIALVNWDYSANSGWENYATSSCLLILRPSLAPNNSFNNIKWTTGVTDTNYSSTGNIFYATSISNFSTQDYFVASFDASSNSLRFDCSNINTGGNIYALTIEALHLNVDQAGIIYISNGDGINNTLPMN